MAIALDASASRAGAADGADGQAADERIPIALSSENPVERWFGVEILDHATGAVDLSRAREGLPLLLDHSTRDQIGVIEDVTLGTDKVIRGQMRFSKSARAQEIRQDVLDGIRRSASIGYQIRELVLEKSDKKSGIDTYRATNWALLEGSIVAVPADPSVGVGRSAQDGDALPVVVHLPEPAPQARSITVSDTPAAAPNGAAPTDTRAQDLAALARQYAATDLLPGWLEKGTSVDAARAALLERISKNAKPMTAPVVELTETEQRRYSVRRAIAAMVARQTGERAEDDGFEREVSEEIKKHLPDYAGRGGILIPTNLRALPPQMLQAAQTFLRAGLDSATATKGPEAVFKEPGDLIDLLRARMKVFALGARSLSGLVGPVAFPKQTGAGTFSMVGENPGSDVAESNLLLGQVALNPKTGQSTTSVSKQLLAQANSVDVDALIRDDLTTIHALGMDSQAINGSGSGNECTGVLNTSGIGSVAGGTNGLAPTWDNIVDLETAVAVANADVAGMGYLTTPGIRGKLKKTVKLSNTIANPIWGDGATPLNGYRAEVSTQVPSNLTKGTSAGVCHAILFGDWNQLVIGQWGALEIIVDPYRLKKQGMIELTSFQMFGVAVRQAAAFAAMKDALTT